MRLAPFYHFHRFSRSFEIIQDPKFIFFTNLLFLKTLHPKAQNYVPVFLKISCQKYFILHIIFKSIYKGDYSITVNLKILKLSKYVADHSFSSVCCCILTYMVSFDGNHSITFARTKFANTTVVNVYVVSSKLFLCEQTRCLL
jgi:hypothetical protein